MTALVPFPGPSGHIHINSIGRDQHNHTNIVSGDQHNVTKNIYEPCGRCEGLTLEMATLFCLSFFPVINDILLETLNPPEMDCTMRTGCLGDTRADVLAQVIDWACKPASLQRTLWLHGPAGSGKSTISTTLVERFRQLKQLGAFLFLSRDNTEGSNPALVTRNLAHQISLSYPEIGVFIVSAVKNNTHTLTSQISSQFQELIINPLSSVSTNSQIVLLLDAMDECGTKTDRKALLNTLAEQSAYLPPTSRLIITSRPDIDMRLAFEFQPHIKPLELDLTSAATQRDILTYIRHQMKSIYKKNRYLGLRWPGDKKVKALARRACGLFVWASIVCNFIDAHDPCKHLDIILKGNQAPTADAALDSLYQTALKVLGVWDDADFVEDFRSIVCIMLVLRNPLSTVAIDNLLTNSDRRPSAHTIEKLSCVICSSPTVRFIHPSVADFLMDKSRGGNEIWFFTPPLCERNMATLCLRRLSKVLHRDMSRFAPLVDREDDTIPKDVAYACVFWVDHVCMIEDDLAPIDQLLETFIDQHILHWFEAMSLLHRSSLMVTLLGQLLDRIQSHWHLSNRRSLQQHVRHWWRFSEEYEECIRECPMEVYSEELHRKFPLTQVQEPLISQPPTPSIFDLFSLTPSSSEAASQDFPSISHPASFPASDFLAPVSRSISPTPSGTSKIPFFSCFFNIVEKQASIYSQSRHSSTSGKRLYTSHSPTRLGRRLSRPSLNHPRHRSSSVGSRRLSRSSLGIDRHRSSSVSSMVQQKSSSDTSFIGPTLHSSSRRHSFSCGSGSPLDGIASAAPTQSRAAATRERDKDTEKLRKEQQLPLAPRTGTPHTRALNIQKALAPLSTDRESKSHHEHRSDKALLSEEQKEKRGVKGKERKGGDPAELTRLVGVCDKFLEIGNGLTMD
jgi:NACHT domain